VTSSKFIRPFPSLPGDVNFSLVNVGDKPRYLLIQKHAVITQIARVEIEINTHPSPAPVKKPNR
jgi:hypothetical protein